ncbi:MAG: S8 family serine peptidase, partial [bacterium]
MKRAVLILVALAVGVGFALVGPDLETQISFAGGSHQIPVIIALNEQCDAAQLNALVDGMPRRARQVEVARILRNWSAEQQSDLMAFLAGLEAEGQVSGIGGLWLVNAAYCNATEAAIRAIEQHPDVWYVDADVKHVPGLLPAAAVSDVTSATDEIAWGVAKVNAPDVWALGYRGQGIVVGVIDTGVNYNHLDLASHMWTDANYPYHGWNFESNSNNPMDASGHGSHCAGSVASDGTAGSQCGVAPEALIMACRVRTVADSLAETQVWAAMEFVVSPPLSPGNGGDVITMSLGWINAWNPMRKLWRDGCNNVGAAGVTMIVAAGNERSTSPPNSCRTPGSVPPPWWNPENIGTGSLSNVISIGATNSSDAIATFSSRGPVEWGTVAGYNDYAYPPGLTRPDVAAPGVDVKSCRHNSNNTYTTMSGTSMATPHTAGVAALMLSKNPNLLPAVIDSILETTALDLGPTGKDMDFGAGRIDALAAVNAIGGSGGPPSLQLVRTTVHDQGGNNNGRLDPGETADLTMTLRNVGGADCANTAGTLRSGDARLTVSDASGTWGLIARGDTAVNSADRFTVSADGAIPPGTTVRCTLHVTGDSADYATSFVIPLVVGQPPTPGMLLMNHDTGYCRLTVSAQGSIGYDVAPADAGSGFQYPKTAASALFYGSFAVGNAEGYVADRHFGRPASGPQNSDLRVVDSLRAVVPPLAGDQHYRGSYRDAGHPSPKGLTITQNSYQAAHAGYDDFVVIEFDIVNEGASAVNGLYAGVFADFDIGSNPATNTATSDESRRFTFMRQSASANPTVGVKILKPTSFANLAAVDHDRYVYPDSAMTDGMKWRFLNGTTVQRNSNRSYDWSTLTSVGPFDLAVGQMYRFAVAFVGGTSEDQARAHADSAQSWYDGNVGLAEGPGRSDAPAQLCEVLPNPFAGRTTVRLQLPRAGRVRVNVVDISGRTVATLVDGELAAGSSSLTWQPGKLAAGVYFVRAETPDGVA